MALQQLNFNFQVDKPISIAKEWSHHGVVGSGDLEILMEKQNLGGAVKVKVVTPVVGFDKVWKLVLDKFITETGLGDVFIEINDNNATPIVVALRLRQAFAEAVQAEQKEGN